LEDVSWAAGSRTILDAVSWRIRPGEHGAILGPNGAGKTTLLRLACGYIWPNAGGKIRRLGKELLDLRQLRRSIGWVTADLAARIPSRERALDTVVSGKFAQIGLWNMQWDPPSDEDFAAARQCLAELGAETLANQPFGTLSQGETQKVLIARARMARPRLIIMDEPCAGLDPGAREALLASLRRFTDRHDAWGLVYVTHHVEEILPAFDRALVLSGGRIAASAPRESVLTAENLSALYDVPMRLVQSQGRYWPVGTSEA